jgi:hypothetical protein
MRLKGLPILFDDNRCLRVNVRLNLVDRYRTAAGASEHAINRVNFARGECRVMGRPASGAASGPQTRHRFAAAVRDASGCCRSSEPSSGLMSATPTATSSIGRATSTATLSRPTTGFRFRVRRRPKRRDRSTESPVRRLRAASTELFLKYRSH